jgi:hypothetical protein
MPGRDHRAGLGVLGFAAAAHLARDDQCLAGAGLANPGAVLSLEVALAVGCGPQQALGADPPGRPPTGAARRLAKAPDVLRGQTPSEQQTHPAAFVIDHGQVAGGMGAKHDRAEELTATEILFPSTDLRPVLTLNGPS